jgi:probable HAF family extracellular repeat protein
VESFVDWWGAKPFTEIQNGADNFSSFRNVQSTPSRCSIADWKVVWPTSARVIPGLTHINNIANDINNRGEVAGASQLLDGTFRSFLWTGATGTHDIGSLPGSIQTVVPCCHTMNDKGEITGFAVDGKVNSRAFLWKHKVMVDLNTLITKNSPLYLLAGLSINARGQIAGYGVTSSGNIHAFLATPCGRDDGDGDRDDARWCGDEGTDTSAGPDMSTQRPNVALSEDTRKQLQQRLGLRH